MTDMSNVDVFLFLFFSKAWEEVMVDDQEGLAT